MIVFKGHSYVPSILPAKILGRMGVGFLNYDDFVTKGLRGVHDCRYLVR